MGVDYALIEMDPDRLARALSALGAPGGLGEPALVDLFTVLGDSLDDHAPLPDAAARRLEAVLVSLAGGRVWSFEGRSLQVAASAVADLDPAYEPLRRIASMEDFDVSLPSPHFDSLDGGLVGAWSAAALDDCVAAVAALAEPESIARADGDRARGAAAILAERWTWQDWLRLREAIAAITATRRVLALSAS